jgi:hypothetical protein
MLFVDSTHVVKTSSDVHYEFFHMLPRLRPEVVVHFHDVLYPFEYPDGWIFQANYSWNEAYLLRAFLMYNRDFRILFWSQPYSMTYKEQIPAEYPNFPQNPGSSIWLVRE